jgi:transposase-like protein
MTMTVLDPALVAGDAGRVSDRGRDRPDPEVPERARRRTFTARYKQEILAAYDAAPSGEKGAILRREGLYSSLITEWRRARDAGALAGLKQPQGRPAADPRDAQIARLRKEKARLEKELAKARFVTEVQSKLQALLETLSDGAADRHPRGLRGGWGSAGELVPAAPGQPGPGAPGGRAAPRPGAAQGAFSGGAGSDPGCPALGPVR